MLRQLLMAAAMYGVVLITGCSMISERLIYFSEINQGNYFSSHDIAQIKTGMTKQQISYILGNPMLKELFGQQVWYYIWRHQLSYDNITQHTLIITFDSHGIVVNITHNVN